MGTWYGSCLIGPLMPIVFLWYVTNSKSGMVYIMNGLQSLDVVLGLEYLHDESIVHGNLKGVRFGLPLAL